MGATFEVQYPVQSMLLHRKGHSEAERLRPAKLQMWTDCGELNGGPGPSGPVRSDSAGPVSPRHREIPLESADCDLDSTKVYLFSQNCIYVLLVSDRIIATKKTSSKKLLSKPSPTTLVLAPNKLRGINSVRLRVIEGSSRSPAGIPLDQANLHYSDQDTAAFTEFQSLQIEFPTNQSRYPPQG